MSNHFVELLYGLRVHLDHGNNIMVAGVSSSSLVWEKKGSSTFKFKQQPDNNSPLCILLLTLKMITKCSKLCNETARILNYTKSE